VRDKQSKAFRNALNGYRVKEFLADQVIPCLVDLSLAKKSASQANTGLISMFVSQSLCTLLEGSLPVRVNMSSQQTARIVSLASGSREPARKPTGLLSGY
jgi:hypothetical protein